MLNIGIIGCGAISRNRHAPEYAANPDCRITGYYDVTRENALDLSKIYGGRVFESLEALLEDKSIDAVSVCTSNDSHAPVTIAALEAGKHVLCEKPMATAIEDGIKMIEAAKASGRQLMIGHNQRLSPAHLRAREILRNGELGKLISFRTTFGHGGPESWSVDKNPNIWFFKKQAAAVGAMGDLGVHKADLIRWLIDDEIQEVKAYAMTLDKKFEDGRPIEVDDNAVCLLKSSTGILGTLTSSWTYYGDEDNSTVLYCSGGVIKLYDNPEFPVVVVKKNGEKLYYKMPGIQTNASQTSSGVIDRFVGSIKNNRPVEISGEDGLAALKIILACMEAAEKNTTVTIQH